MVGADQRAGSPLGSRSTGPCLGLGNVIGLVNESPSLKRSYEYDVWGELVGGSDGASFNGRDRARFKGALSMGDLGAPDLYYMRNRWYEPSTSRFLSEDPIGLAGGINLYVFAGNNPVSGRDPTGLDECDGNSLGHYHYSEAFYGVSSGDALIVTVQRTWHDCSGSIGSGGGSMDGPAGWGGTGGSSPVNGSDLDRYVIGQSGSSLGLFAKGQGEGGPGKTVCVGFSLSAAFSVAGDVALLAGVGVAWRGVQTVKVLKALSLRSGSKRKLRAARVAETQLNAIRRARLAAGGRLSSVAGGVGGYAAANAMGESSRAALGAPPQSVWRTIADIVPLLGSDRQILQAVDCWTNR